VRYKIVARQAVRVAYTTSVGDPSTSDAFVRLEHVVPLKGNRFFATFDAATREYRACVALKAGENAEQYGLPEAVLAGGKYATANLVGAFAEIVARIGETFELMRQEHGRDPSRLPIEYYKRHTEIVLYLPIGQ
jgi:DNA gyrase inhibitor GyrI